MGWLDWVKTGAGYALGGPVGAAVGALGGDIIDEFTDDDQERQDALKAAQDRALEMGGKYIGETPEWLKSGLQQNLAALQQRTQAGAPSIAGIKGRQAGQALAGQMQQAAASGRGGPGVMLAAMKGGLGQSGQLAGKTSQALAQERLKNIGMAQDARNAAFQSMFAPQLARAQSIARQFGIERGTPEGAANWEKLLGAASSLAGAVAGGSGGGSTRKKDTSAIDPGSFVGGKPGRDMGSIG